MKFVTVHMVEAGATRYNEDTEEHERIETTKPAVINAAAIRAFYARRDGKPGTRITFNDGGGFAVAETPEALAALVATGDIVHLALAAPASETAN